MGTTGVRFKDAFVDSITVTGEVDAVTGDFSGAVDIAGDLTLSAGADGALTFGAASSVKVVDNNSAALVFEEANNAYITLVTTDGSEAVRFDKALDINAAAQIDSTLTVGVDDTGHDVKFFGATSGAYMLWDESADDLILAGAGRVVVPDGQLVLGSTAVSATAAEINLIDGGTSRGTTAVANGDGFLHNDGGTMRMTNVSKLADLFAGTGIDASSSVLSVAAAQTGITSILATDVKIGEDDQTKIDFETADEIHFYAANAEQVYVADGIFGPQTDSDVDLGSNSVRWKDAYVDSVTSTGAIAGSTGTFSGILKTDDTTNATSTTDGSLQTDGGLSVVLDAVFGDDVSLLSDSAILNFGANSEIKLTHVHDTGLLLTDSGGTPTLQFHDANESISSDGGHLIFTSNGVTFDWPSADGSDGQQLTTDGNGVLTWAAAGSGGGSTAADDIGAGDAAVTLTTSTGNITIDAAANDSDIILKGTDGGNDTVFLTIDGSDAGTAIFNHDIHLDSDGAILAFGDDQEITLTHVHDKGLILEANGLTAMPEFELRNTNADATGARLLFNKELSSNQEADNDVLGVIDFVGQDSDDNDTIYAAIEGSSADVTSNTEDGVLKFTTMAAGSAVEAFRLESGKAYFPTDSHVLNFGADSDVSITHNADKGLTIQQTATGDNHHTVLTLASPEAALATNETVASIEWKSDDTGGTDANEVCAAIDAIARANFTDTVNNASLVFRTAASEVATAKMELDSAGDLSMLIDGSAIKFGANADIALIHDHDQGLKLTNTKTGDNNEVILTLEAREAIIGSGETVGSIQFKPNDSDGTDGAEVCAAIDAVATANFAADSNATKLVFRTGESEAATAKMEIEEDGDLNLLVDNMTVSFGVNEDITMKHEHDSGLTITNNIANTDNRPCVLTLASEENAIIALDDIAAIDFKAGDSSGSDAALVTAQIKAMATAEFTSTVNTTALIFSTATDGAAVEQMSIGGNGRVGIGTGEVSASPDSRLEVVDDTAGNQLKLSFDASNGSTMGSTSNGSLVFTPGADLIVNSFENLTAASSNQPTISKHFVQATSDDAAKGILLPTGSVVGHVIHIANYGSAVMRVIPQSGQAINNGQNGVYWNLSAGGWVMMAWNGSQWNNFGALSPS